MPGARAHELSTSVPVGVEEDIEIMVERVVVVTNKMMINSFNKERNQGRKNYLKKYLKPCSMI